MEEKLKKLIDSEIFKNLILEVKGGVYTDSLYKIGELIWNEARADLIERLSEFERDEKVLIITEEDKEMLHDFDYTSSEHAKTRAKFRKFLKDNLDA